VSKNQIIASFLAQEAVEYVHNLRHNNALSGVDWLQGTGPCASESGCTVDVVNDDIDNCSCVCCPVKYDSAGGFYNYQTGEDTIFTRTVKIQKIDLDAEAGVLEDEASITVEVSWQEAFGAKSLVLEEHIFNWR
jgi:hypothetical protein